MSKKDEVADKKRSINALIQKLNKDAKLEVLTTADRAPNPYSLRYPTGCMEIDLTLGGGFPAGGMSAVSGPDGAGKSLLLYLAMAQYQRFYGHRAAIALAPIEFIPDYYFMRYCGVNVAVPDEMIAHTNSIRQQRGVPPFTKDEVRQLKSQTGEFIIIRGQTGENTLENVLSCYESNQFGIIGVDSINAFQSGAEAASEGLEDTIRQASKASVLSRFCDRFHPLTLGLRQTNYTALLVTGQVRANRERANAPGPMQKYIKPYAEVLPYAIRHAALIRLLIWQVEKIREGKGGPQLGQVRNWEVTKGKAGTHDGIRGEADFSYEFLFDNFGSVIRAGMTTGVIQEVGGTLSIVRRYDGAILHKDIPNRQALVQALYADPEFELRVRYEILAASGVSCMYRL